LFSLASVDGVKVTLHYKTGYDVPADGFDFDFRVARWHIFIPKLTYLGIFWRALE
jgi:hypothetical protein